jgi:hypothetical protein
MKEQDQRVHLEGRMQDAINELQTTIGQRYPTASFTLAHPEDEPTSVELTAIVDVEDPDEVLDTVIERVIQFQVDEQLPIHVVPVRPPARVAAALQEQRRSGRRSRTMPLLDRLPLSGR